ncbi:MAG: Ser/Thr protein kinase RdoA (MazF antagonist) [Hyphomicrobiaceae bacterium]|jgi:Ser/Thr protein kinase RdoA (MazF antagonist)
MPENENSATTDPWGESATRFFYELTPERVLDAVDEAGLATTGRFIVLNSMENRVYQVEVEDGEDETRFVVAKFYRPGRWSQEQVLDEHRFLADLTAAEVPVIAPLAFPEGHTLAFLKELGIYFTLFPRVGGRAPEDPNHETMERLGRSIARLHAVGETGDRGSRLQLDVATYGLGNLAEIVSAGVLPASVQGRYTSVVERLCGQIEPLFARASVLPRIHGDCHVGNILLANDTFFFLDFDDMLAGPAVQDLWLLCSGDEPEDRALRESLIDGYEQLRHFDRRELVLIEPLRALRMIHFASWITRRRADPAFVRAFPDFGTDGWWEIQTADLEEQVTRIGQATDAVVSGNR